MATSGDCGVWHSMYVPQDASEVGRMQGLCCTHRDDAEGAHREEVVDLQIELVCNLTICHQRPAQHMHGTSHAHCTGKSHIRWADSTNWHVTASVQEEHMCDRAHHHGSKYRKALCTLRA